MMSKKNKTNMKLLNSSSCLTSIIILLLCLISLTRCFNLEHRLPIIKYGPENSYFGYSVAEHVIAADKSKWLLVGAPLAENLQPNTTKSGALFKCPISQEHKDCVQIITDGIKARSSDLVAPAANEMKNGQWLGVTVQSASATRNNSMAFVCAHRYVVFKGESQTALGYCITLTNDLQYEDFKSPCSGRPTQRNHEEYGYCQSGVSGILLPDKYGTMIVGAPGTINWRGTLFSMSIDGDFLGRDKKNYDGPHNENNSPVDKYSYLGMSVTGGRYFNGTYSYVAGAPRSKGHGEAVIYTKDRNINPINYTMTLEGEQFASNFGYEMITADINGDFLDDLIIAAPFYFGRNQGGAVYIYQNNDNTLPTKHTLKLTGTVESRFGIALTNLGDINKDYCDDIAIGAPYEGDGVVYIYLGTKNGLSEKPSQIITSSSLGISPNINTFGSSLSGGVDLDDNDYPDLLIGSYNSSAVIALLARPIINIRTDVITDNLKNINPINKTCEVDAKTNLTCFTFDACCTIEPYAVTASKTSEILDLILTVEAETFNNFKKFSRVFFGDDTSLSVTKKRLNILTKTITVSTNGVQNCRKVTVYLKENNRDIQTPIKFRLNYTIVEPRLEKSGLISLNPILDQTQADRTFEATFHKNCGDDDICIAQLEVDASLKLDRDENTFAYKLKLGLSNEIQLTVDVRNLEEDAYEAQLFVKHLPTISYISASRGLCSQYNKTIVSCSLGNPMTSSASHKVTLRFDPSLLVDSAPKLSFIVFANSTSEQKRPQEDTVLNVNIVKEAELSIKGRAVPEQSFYSGKIKEEKDVKYLEDIGTPFFHIYHIFNDGPWIAPQVDIKIQWPSKYYDEETKKEKWLLYLDQKPIIETTTEHECFIRPGLINPLKLNKRPIIEPAVAQLQADPTIQQTTSNKSVTYTAESSEKSSYSKYSSSSINRVRREINFDVGRPENFTDNRKQEIIHLDCSKSNVKCEEFSCTLYNMRKTGAYLNISGILWNSTLVEHYPRVDSVKIFSNVKIEIPSSFGIITNTSDDWKSVETRAYPELSDPTADKSIPIWIYVVAILSGILILALFSFCLYHLGFFKRKRPDPTLSGNLEKSGEHKPFISN